VSSSYNETVQLWDVAIGAALQTLKSYNSIVNSVAFLPDSKQVMSSFYDETVQLWDATTGAMLQTLEGYNRVWSVVFSLNSKLLLIL
jgi:WD40 repeat protein